MLSNYKLMIPICLSYLYINLFIVVDQLANWIISAVGIPDYPRKMTQNDISILNSRPNKATDFRSGQTTAQPGITYNFNVDIGYNNGNGCNYFPPNVKCPVRKTTSTYFNIAPAAETSNIGCFLPSQVCVVNINPSYLHPSSAVMLLASDNV